MTIFAGPQFTKTICILDSAAGQTTIDEGFARSLALKLQTPTNKKIVYLDRQVSLQTSKCSLVIHSQDKKTSFTIQAQAVKGFADHCLLWPWSNYLTNHPHLRDIQVPLAPLPPIGTILIGTDNPDLLQALEYRKSGRLQRPIGVRTVLGWGFLGPDPPGEDSKPSDKKMSTAPLVSYKTTTASILEELVNRQFEIENIGALEMDPLPSSNMTPGPKDRSSWSPEERLADSLMVVNYKSADVHPFFEGKIPWKQDHHLRLLNNFAAVELRQTRSHSTESLRKKGIADSEIDNIIQSYQDKGYIERVPLEEEQFGWYLPFFEVVNRHKSTPIRLVFDAKAKYKGVSLNQQILDTPNRLNDLTLVLSRMRTFKFVLAGDITEMFLQIRLHPDDKQFHRFTHRGQHFQWTRTLFGNKASPNLSQKVLDELCKLNPELRQACDTVSNSCYMDDCIDSRDSENDIVSLAKQLPKLLRRAGMKICKMYTNHPGALSVIDPELRAQGFEFQDRNLIYDDQKVLGLVYNASKDELAFNVKHSTVDAWKGSLDLAKWTKRGILKAIASHYDPLGLASPITIRPRRFFQRIWTMDLGWDDTLSDELQQLWESTLVELLQLKYLSFPRWIGSTKKTALQMHVFCDASEGTYACAVYLRSTDDSTVSVGLLGAKARVTPIKTQSVSRSELDACVLGTRMARHFNAVYRLEKDHVFFYTDSKNALFWISSTPKKLKVFVQNRVAEIQRSTSKAQWGHIGTADNPADIPTRDITVEDLQLRKDWYFGPAKLQDPTYVFQSFEASDTDLQVVSLEEFKLETYLTLPTEPYQEILLAAGRLSVGEIYDGFSKLLRFVRRLVQWKNLRNRYTLPMTVLIRASQSASFGAELDRLRDGKPCSKGPLAKYSPFLDDEGIMRANSRLSNDNELAYDTRFPPLLSGRQSIARLLVKSFHYKYGHPVGTTLALAKIQRGFVVLGVKRLLAQVANACLTCKRLHPRPDPPLMGPLPLDITRGTGRAFSSVGLDFAGPFTLRGAGRGLRAPIRHVLVLTCLQTRAVHFEVCTDQTTYSVVMALIRFTCVRGDPEVIYSDNQTSLVGASQALRAEYERHKPEGMVWKTIVPRTPHQGGRWERMVRSMKRALLALGGSRLLKEDEFLTILARAADLLNSRPLTRGSSGNLSAFLTPNHFLIGRAESHLSDKAESNNRLLGEKYRKLERCLAELWEKFVDDVLLDARSREKWRNPVEELRVGEPALVLQTNPLEDKWELGLIEDVIRGQDGQTRSALVRTTRGVVRRSALHLIALPREEKSEDEPQRS
jgi:hypothetical protein